MHKIELLSPAGNFDALKAAVNYGADAIYLGGTSFSARAFANNFNHEELIEAVNYCHLRGVKIYVTLNTLLNEDELENAIKEAKFYYDNNVDALIIQDLGLFYRLKKELPNFPLHASTQMHIHNLSGVRNAKRLGFKKVVIARESSLDLIKEACKEDIEIECFIHGAICVSYSGQCLMSSVNKNRSANKGMCAQPCRLKYQLFDQTSNNLIKTDNDYLISPKDMFLLEDIPSLIKAGVSSLKIEGRLKSPSYVGLVTKIYREAIDAYYNGQEYLLSSDEFNNLLKVFNRGFTNSYLYQNDKNVFGNIRPNHMGIKVGEVISYKNNCCEIKLNDNVNQFDGIRIINKYEDVGKILNTLSIKGKYVSSANANDIIEIKIDKKVKKGDVVVKTLDYKLENNILNYKMKKRPIDLKITIKEDKPFIVECNLDNLYFKKEYSINCKKAINKPITVDELKNAFNKSDNSPFYINNFNCDIDDLFIIKSELNEIRRKFYKDFENYLLSFFKRPNIDKLILDDIKIENFNEILYENDILGFIKDPVVNTKGIYNHLDVVSEFGGLFNKEKNKIAYYTLNICNSYAYEFLTRIGFNKIILSSELSDNSIKRLIEVFYKRNKLKIRPYVLVYGKRSLMYLKGNPFKKYIDNNHNYLLKENENEYLIKFNELFNEIIEKEPYIKALIDNNIYNPFIIVDNDLRSIKNRLNIML